VIEPADLLWRDGQPYSRTFEDIYHARDGRQEVERVFLQPAGFDQMLTSGRGLRLGELGFGTGLNFVVAARRCLAAHVPLHFISFEAAPLDPADLDRVSRERQAEEPVYRELSDCYPPLLPGWHQRRLYDGRVVLSLFFGQAAAGISDLLDQGCQPFDLWLLDGFAPDRNPAMWEDGLLADIGRTATRGTRVTTFTSAGRVRRGLGAAGFDMRRVDQRPHKRESLAGAFTGEGRPRLLPWSRVSVVGAGIAGASVARAAAEAGSEVRVVEQASTPASGASAMPATVMHPRLHHDGSPGSTLRAVAYAHALAAVARFADQPGTGVHRTGALQIPSPNYPAERLAEVARVFAPTGIDVRLVEGPEAAEIAGATALSLPRPVLWFADACLVDTPTFTQTLLDHPGIEVVTGCRLDDWPDDLTILACGMDVRRFDGAAYLELGRVHGQLDVLRPQGALAGLTVPIVGNGYVTPMPGRIPGAVENLIAAGATYEYEPWPADRATRRNLTHVDRLEQDGALPVRTCRGERTVSSDRNPVVGPLYDADGQSCVERLVSVGHGSMGTVTSHLAADLIAARIRRSFEPLAAAERALISPLRFRHRQAKRGYRFGALP